MDTKYKEGDLVRVISKGSIYSSHYSLFKKLGFINQEKNNSFKSKFPEKEIFIIKKAMHIYDLVNDGFTNDTNNKYYIVNIKNLNEEILIAEEGIELAKESFISLSALINNDEYLKNEFKRLLELITNNK